MESHTSKRGRRHRNNVFNRPTLPFINSSLVNSSLYIRFINILKGLNGVLIMCGLMGLIYIMLEYHCTACGGRKDLVVISKSIEDIGKNLTSLQTNYVDIEKQITQLSLQLPKIGEQMEILEIIGNTLENSGSGWNPKSHVTMPNVDVYLRTTENGKNSSIKASKHLPVLVNRIQ